MQENEKKKGLATAIHLHQAVFFFFSPLLVTKCMVKLNGLFELVLSDRWLARHVGLRMSAIVRGLWPHAFCWIRSIKKFACKVPPK